MIKITEEMDAALDGQARWMVSIVLRFTGKPINKWIDPEDFISDFIVFYLKNRHKFDATRASRSRFVMVLARSFCHKYVQKRRIPTKNLLAERATYNAELTADEHGFIQAASPYLKMGRHSVESRMDSLASKMSIGRAECREMLESITEKVKKSNNNMVLIHN
jgi:hypothetical protein